MSKIWAGLAVAVVAGLIGGSALWIGFGRPSDKFAACRGGEIGGGDIGGPFTLLDSTGKTVTDKDVITKPSLVYFGYTACPDVCPTDNARNADAVDILNGRKIDAQSVFITVDPARDTPEVMGNYAENLSPKLVGLSGTEAEIKKAVLAYKAFYNANAPDADGYYLVDHTTFTYLTLPGEGAVEFFPRDTSAEDVAKKAACYIDAAGLAAQN